MLLLPLLCTTTTPLITAFHHQTYQHRSYHFSRILHSLSRLVAPSTTLLLLPHPHHHPPSPNIPASQLSPHHNLSLSLLATLTTSLLLLPHRHHRIFTTTPPISTPHHPLLQASKDVLKRHQHEWAFLHSIPEDPRVLPSPHKHPFLNASSLLSLPLFTALFTASFLLSLSPFSSLLSFLSY